MPQTMEELAEVTQLVSRTHVPECRAEETIHVEL